MKPLLQRRDVRGFIAAIVLMGVLRFVLSLADLPDSAVKYASMTVVILVGAVYFAIVSQTHLERLKEAYLLLLPYMIVEVAALSYTWITGDQTIFQADAYNFGFDIKKHTLGHLVGGFTWEPLSTFVFMEIVWLVRAGIRRLR